MRILSLRNISRSMMSKNMEENQSAYQWAVNREGYRVLIRNKHPRIVVEVPDDTDDKQLADALKKAAEFVLKGHLNRGI